MEDDQILEQFNALDLSDTTTLDGDDTPSDEAALAESVLKSLEPAAEPAAEPEAEPAPETPAETKTIKIDGQDVVVPESGDLADAEITIKVDGEETKIKLKDAVRAERTYQAADRFMHKAKQDAVQFETRIKELKGDLHAMLLHAGYEDPGAALAQAALDEIAGDEYAELTNIPLERKTVDQFRRQEQLRAQLQQNEARKRESVAAAERKREESARFVAERKALADARREKVPALLESTGHRIDDPIVEAVIIRTIQLNPGIGPEAIAERVQQLVPRKTDFDAMSADDILSHLGEAAATKLREKLVKVTADENKQRLAERVRQAAPRDSEGRFRKNAVSIDDFF